MKEKVVWWSNDSGHQLFSSYIDIHYLFGDICQCGNQDNASDMATYN